MYSFFSNLNCSLKNLSGKHLDDALNALVDRVNLFNSRLKQTLNMSQINEVGDSFFVKYKDNTIKYENNIQSGDSVSFKLNEISTTGIGYADGILFSDANIVKSIIPSDGFLLTTLKKDSTPNAPSYDSGNLLGVIEDEIITELKPKDLIDKKYINENFFDSLKLLAQQQNNTTENIPESNNLSTVADFSKFSDIELDALLQTISVPDSSIENYSLSFVPKILDSDYNTLAANFRQFALENTQGLNQLIPQGYQSFIDFYARNPNGLSDNQTYISMEDYHGLVNVPNPGIAFSSTSMFLTSENNFAPVEPARWLLRRITRSDKIFLTCLISDLGRIGKEKLTPALRKFLSL